MGTNSSKAAVDDGKLEEVTGLLKELTESLAQKPKRGKKRKSDKILYTVSHLVMGGVMLMFFAGVALAGYAVIFLGEPVGTLLDFVKSFALPVGLGYLVKAFGENVAKIVLGVIIKPNEPSGNTYEGSDV
ncbi:MAG: hypothetical protein LBR72_01555 [Oscillospiraceae bacterium]|jgi:hypothetical protein|nr:hypothetical protein [Oscillospiraceae bacterium]